MKRLIILSLLCLVIACCSENSKDKQPQYPQIVSQKGLERMYDSAVVEMYRINSCCKCNCLASTHNPIINDTTNILMLDIRLDTICITSDTTTFWFSFFNKSLKKENRFLMISHNITECNFNGISFVGNNLNAFPLYLGELKLSEISDSLVNYSKDNFKSCLKKNNLSSTLKYYFPMIK
jgi:hypothetical protein